MTDATTNAGQLGAEIGRETLADNGRNGAARAAARELVQAVLNVNPKAKLPAVFTKERVRRWMSETGVKEGMMREAFAIARKDMRAKLGAPPDVVLPPKRNRSRSQTAANTDAPIAAIPPAMATQPERAVKQAKSETKPKPAPLPSMFDTDGMVPN